MGGYAQNGPDWVQTGLGSNSGPQGKALTYMVHILNWWLTLIKYFFMLLPDAVCVITIARAADFFPKKGQFRAKQRTSF